MQGIISYEALVIVGVAAFVLAKLWEAIKDRLGSRWESLTDAQRETVGYAVMVINALMMFFTGLDALPGFNAVSWAPWMGRALTCIAGGLGPSIVYDIWLDKPAPPQP